MSAEPKAEAEAPKAEPVPPKVEADEPKPAPDVAATITPRREDAAGLAGSISIGAINPVHVEAPKLQAEVRPLSQEDLERYWEEAAEELDLALLMEKGKPRVGEHNGRIEIDALSTYFHEEFKPHRIDVMELLRKKSGMPMLECKVNPLYVEKDEVIYSPQDKYKAMMQTNPKLVELRKLFPQIDY